jgi:hypothetical protein
MSSEVIVPASPILISNLNRQMIDTVQAGEEGEETQSIPPFP